MAEVPSQSDPIVDLTLRYLDGQLSDGEVSVLADRLRGDQALADRFVAICYQDQLVSDIGAAAMHDEDPEAEVSVSVMLDIIKSQREARIIEAAAVKPVKFPEPSTRLQSQSATDQAKKRVIVIPRWAFYGGIAAVLVLAVSLFMVLRPDPVVTSPGSSIAKAPSVAKPAVVVAELSRARNATWGTPDGQAVAQVPGQIFENDELMLLDGLAEIEMGNGARVILQGPTKARFISDKTMQLDRGQLTAVVVERARGFEVLTSQARVVDLGTEFGVKVDDLGQTRTEVFTGLVTLAPIRDGVEGVPVSLNEGQGLLIDRSGTARSVVSDELRYVRDREFEALVQADVGSAYHRWLAYTYAIRRDPSVVAYYVFDQRDAATNTLINRADGKMVAGDGALGSNQDDIARPLWADGRFEQTRSLQFGLDDNGFCRGVVVPDSDALDLDREMTFAMWVFPVSRDTSWNTLVSKRDIPPMRLNYQFSLRSFAGKETGIAFQWGAGIDDNRMAAFASSPELDEPLTSDWRHIAITSDGKTLCWYYNGKLVLTQDQPMPPIANDAPLLIGTASPQIPTSFQRDKRPLFGRMSELLIANRVLSDLEVRALYEAGRPDPQE